MPYPAEYVGTVKPLELHNAGKQSADLTVLKEQHHHTLLMTMVGIAAVWLMGCMIGLLINSFDAKTALALANPGFAILAGVGGYKFGQS